MVPEAAAGVIVAPVHSCISEVDYCMADSRSVANTLRISCRDDVRRLVHQAGEHFVGGREAKRLARPTVEPGGDGVEFGLRAQPSPHFLCRKINHLTIYGRLIAVD